MQQRSSRPVAIWLLIGVGMIIIQVLLGGITRLTGSGLSITEWKPIMGALPPMNETDWQLAFAKYKQIPQFQYINSDFSLSDFKFIFFWEWFHRLWARIIGVVFLIPFVIFLLQKRFRPSMVKPLLILFLLGALQGLVGWIMVASGLQDNVYVSHIRLAIHFILALGVLCYTLWFALELLVPANSRVAHAPLRKPLFAVTGLLVVQLIYGAFMAGLKAATAAPTWPRINGSWWPDTLFTGPHALTDHLLTVHFIHRNLAYLVTLAIVYFWWQARKVSGSNAWLRGRNWPLVLVFMQVLLGILTVLYSPQPQALLWLGVTHQFVAMCLLMSLVWMAWLLRDRKAAA
jgi:heme a synthase